MSRKWTAEEREIALDFIHGGRATMPEGRNFRGLSQVMGGPLEELRKLRGRRALLHAVTRELVLEAHAMPLKREDAAAGGVEAAIEQIFLLKDCRALAPEKAAELRARAWNFATKTQAA